MMQSDIISFVINIHILDLLLVIVSLSFTLLITMVCSSKQPNGNTTSHMRQNRNQDSLMSGQPGSSAADSNNSRAGTLANINSNHNNDNDDSPRLKSILLASPSVSHHSSVSTDEDTDDQHVSMVEYSEELNLAAKPSPKGRDYEKSAYISGPYSMYAKFLLARRKGVKAKNDKYINNTGQHEQDEMINMGSTELNQAKPMRKNRTRVTFQLKAKGRPIPKDQLRPHKLRKDRQQKNIYRKIHVQNKIKELGGHIIDKEQNKFVYVPPGTQQTMPPVAANDNLSKNIIIAK